MTIALGILEQFFVVEERVFLTISLHLLISLFQLVKSELIVLEVVKQELHLKVKAGQNDVQSTTRSRQSLLNQFE